ncbi:MAG: type II toxin-antitoxin system VapC family toxin [Thermoprotei archaeon]
MTFVEKNYYLDTSAFVKRYVTERGSDVVDGIFRDAYRGIVMISTSYWNLGEAVAVFDKYERRLGVNARELMKNMLREVRTLRRLGKFLVIGITPSILRKSLELILKHHIYVADAIQIITAKMVKRAIFVTADKELANIAKMEDLETLVI